jgi:hypothetical protein
MCSAVGADVGFERAIDCDMITSTLRISLSEAGDSFSWRLVGEVRINDNVKGAYRRPPGYRAIRDIKTRAAAVRAVFTEHVKGIHLKPRWNLMSKRLSTDNYILVAEWESANVDV